MDTQRSKSGIASRPILHRSWSAGEFKLDAQNLLTRTDSPEIALLTALAFRGFLLEADDQRYWLSDNGDGRDRHALVEAFKELQIQHPLVGQRQRVDLAYLAAALENLPQEQIIQQALDLWPRRGTESCLASCGWATFRRRRHGYKVEIATLDRDVALLVRGLSAAGVLTTYSCAGHHEKARFLHVQLASEFDSIWAATLARLLDFSPAVADQKEAYTGVARLDSPQSLPPERLPHAARWTAQPALCLFAGDQDRWPTGHWLLGPRVGDATGTQDIRVFGALLYALRRAARVAREQAIRDVGDTSTEEHAIDRWRDVCRQIKSLPDSPAPDCGLFAPWLGRAVAPRTDR